MVEVSKIDQIDEIIKLWKQITKVLEKDTPQVWLELHLTTGQLKSLMYINAEGSTNSKNLASALHVTPPNVTGIVDRLVEQGLVSREENPQNRRMQILTATAKGEDLLGELIVCREIHLSKLLARVSREDLASLSQGFSALMQASDIETSP